MTKLAFNTVGIVGTHKNPLVAETVTYLMTLLPQWGVSVLLEREIAATQINSKQSGCAFDAIGKRCDLVIVVGGDGNLLHSARVLSKICIPVIGINRGHFGYLTDIAPDQIEATLKPILYGEYLEEKRFLIEGYVSRNGQKVGMGNALNDIVLFPGEVAQLIEFELKVGGKFVYSQRSDGLIIATPTGSTAYSLSAGGPIMQPDLDVMLLVPKFPHTLTSRPLVVDSDSEIEIHIGDYNKISPRISFDGHDIVSLKSDDVIRIRKQQKVLRLIHPKDHDYYKTLRNKLNWGTQLIPLKRR